jgi:hypothetical protein
MNAEKMFETAVRNKMRFPYKGQISVEDLWDLDVNALDGVFKTLNSKVKVSQEESLLRTRSKESEELMVQIEIVKYIVSVKLAEAEARKNAEANRAKRQQILGILADKQESDLKNKSPEELQAMLAALE